jgi:hypothetical protein
MKKSFLLFTIAFLAGVSSLYADGKTRDQYPLQVQYVSTSFGTGALVGMNINDTVFIGIEHTSGEGTYESENQQQTSGDQTEVNTLDFDFETNTAMIRISPWESSGFFIQAGTATRDWYTEETRYDTCVGESTTTCDVDLLIKADYSNAASNFALVGTG